MTTIEKRKVLCRDKVKKWLNEYTEGDYTDQEYWLICDIFEDIVENGMPDVLVEKTFIDEDLPPLFERLRF
jgi:hypothetical protein